MTAATEHHPETSQLVIDDDLIGIFHTVYKSGKITPKIKADMLDRIDELKNAVNRARSIANRAEIVDTKIGAKIFEYINKNL